jgi:hypothetical protein
VAGHCRAAGPWSRDAEPARGPSSLTLNGIKKHVGILVLAGLVEAEKVGRVRECRLGPAMTLGEAGEWIEAHRRAWEGRLDRFERFVERSR